VLANKDVVALQHSDVANLAGYLSLSIPVLSFYLTKGAAAMGSQVAGSVLSSGAFTSAGVAATTADGNWSFNNMSMDNVSQNKMDTNLMQRQGQQRGRQIMAPRRLRRPVAIRLSTARVQCRICR
jgi:conjugal transfer mating pair stabilization protein TraG